MLTLTEGGYQIGGVDVDGLARDHGLPLYVYDADTMVRQFRRLETALEVPSKKICFACKALTSLPVLRLFRALGGGVDTVSIEEVELALRAGFDPEDVVFTPSSVSLGEIEAAIEKGVRINVDNLEALEHVGHEHPDLPVCVRINPHIFAGGHAKVSVGHIDSKFGISIHQLPLIERLVDRLNVRVAGVHMHTGSEILDAEVFLQAAELLLEVARRLGPVDYVDLGSGFKVRYRRDDVETDIEELGAAVSRRFRAFCEEMGRDVTLMFEPGKFLVSEAGTFLARVNLVKQTTSTVFACVDSGFHHLIRPMFYDAYHEVLNVSHVEGRRRIYTVVGTACETDNFAVDRALTEVRKDDVLAFRNAGAYGYAMSSNYNSRTRPAEVLVLGGKAHLIRRRETLDDLLATQLDPALDFSGL
jgi:diaminopimelate decarboxylase